MQLINCLLLLLIFNCSNMYGQYELSIGTKWTYSSSNIPANKPESIEIAGELEFEGHTWYRLEGIDGCAADFDGTYIRNEGDIMYMFHEDEGLERVLYDFSLQEDAEWMIEIPNTLGAYNVRIDSIGEVEINSEIFEVQYINDANFGDYIIKGIGSNKYLFPQGNICDPQYFGIRCFNNGTDDIDFDPNHECDESYIPTSTSENNLEKDITLFPNPANSYFKLNHLNSSNFIRLGIYDLNGKQVAVFNDPSNSYDVSNLNNGLYFVEIHSKTQRTMEKILVLK